MLSAIPQPVVATLTRAAIFLVVTMNSGREDEAAVRTLCGDLAALLRAVGFRDLEGRLSCVMAFGSDAWDRLFGAPRPKELHPFREIHGRHHAVATPGDILFHIRATRMDLCFELATQIMSRLGGAVVHGGRGARLQLFRRSRPDRLRRWDGEPGGSGCRRRHHHRRGGCGLRRRQLRDRAEIPARPDAVERAARRGTGRRSSAEPSCPTSSWTMPSSRPRRTTP